MSMIDHALHRYDTDLSNATIATFLLYLAVEICMLEVSLSKKYLIFLAISYNNFFPQYNYPTNMLSLIVLMLNIYPMQN